MTGASSFSDGITVFRGKTRNLYFKTPERSLSGTKLAAKVRKRLLIFKSERRMASGNFSASRPGKFLTKK